MNIHEYQHAKQRVESLIEEELDEGTDPETLLYAFQDALVELEESV